MNFKRLLTYTAAIVLFYSCGNSTKSAKVELSVPVNIEDVKTSSIKSYITTTGTATASKEIDITNEVAGKYMLRKNPRTGDTWKLGDEIKKGELLVSIVDEEYVNSISIESAELNLEIQKLQFEKNNSLYKLGGVTQIEVSNAEVSYKSAEKTYLDAKLQLAKMSIKAPFSGVVTSIPHYTSGTEIETGSEIVSIMEYSDMLLEISLPEKYLSDLSVGLGVDVSTYRLSNDTIAATISQLSPAVDPTTRTFSGVVTIDNSEFKINPGVFVKASIIADSKDDVIVVPKELLMSSRRGKYLFIAENGTARMRTVKTGLENEDMVEIKSGLSVNDRLIISGYETLSDRSKVKVVQ